MDLSTWSVSYITKDIIALEITNPTIINVYMEVPTSILSDLGEAIGKLDPHDEPSYSRTSIYTTLSGQQRTVIAVWEYQPPNLYLIA